ncbi:acyl carrier protein [Ktedonospora formicarum]|uniref:Carrier domain-containing protein n=1 Tax=Ktedonospora formicarum TaxID=2778364 RepID=A0A8J3IDG6_9CHLR|nr:acyl carrier protein [Ktedonospora formicarum]GHO50253.1 hypothetical protein KSX_84160 [Ktedonospora formicarum]
MNVRAELLHAMQDLHIDIAKINTSTRLKEDLDMDSTEIVEMAVALEKRLPLTIDDAALGKLHTFGEVEQFVLTLMDNQVAVS